MNEPSRGGEDLKEEERLQASYSRKEEREKERRRRERAKRPKK